MAWVFFAGFVVGGVCGICVLALVAMSARDDMGQRF